jgi:SAM-dependent methyltransferase
MGLDPGVAFVSSRGWREWGRHSIVNCYASARTQLIDAKFTHRLGIHTTPVGRALKYPAIGLERVSRRFQGAYQDLLFRRYTALHGLHYGPTGRGYQTIAGGSHEDHLARYQGQFSRLAFFADEYADILRYEDGDTFVDLGCGSGQNIRFLAERYSTSMVVGTDMNADAVALVRECEPSANVQLSVGDMRDADFLSRLMSDRIDHVVLSHVFSLIFAPSARETRELRQRFIDRVVAGSRKSVIILDNFGKRGELSIAIEQKQRAHVTDDVMSYFSKHVEGRAFMVESQRSQAIIFSRKN